MRGPGNSPALRSSCEWSSGAQTDFTNYAAQRLSERGLLREEDPIRLQRAVSEIAMTYAKGGDVDGRFVPVESPLPSLIAPHAALGWTSSDLRSRIDNSVPSTVHRTADDNDNGIRRRQTAANVAGGATLGDDLKARVNSTGARASDDIRARRDKLSDEQGALSDRYNGVVQRDRINHHHGGNRAVLDTVGIQEDNRAAVGQSPPQATIPKRHFSEDGTPTADGDEPHRSVAPKRAKEDATTRKTTERKRAGATDSW